MTAAAASLAMFNLVCTGMGGHVTQPESGSILGGIESFKPFTDVYRVDLTSKRWCAGDCTETHPLHSVTKTNIYFRYVENEIARIYLYVNRENGNLMDMTIIGKNADSKSGTCKRAPFTGFPAQKF